MIEFSGGISDYSPSGVISTVEMMGSNSSQPICSETRISIWHPHRLMGGLMKKKSALL